MMTESTPVLRLQGPDGERFADDVVVEEPLEIRVDNNSLTTTMRTPGDDFDLAIGHLLTEGLLHGADEVATLMHCTDLDESGSPTFNVVDVTLAPGAVLHRAPRERTQGMTSACGVCGSASVDAVRTSSRYAVAGDPLLGRRVTREEYEAVVDRALDLDFENLFIQEVDEQNLAPDFDKAEPFPWD